MANRISAWIRRHLPTQRRLIQLYAALLYNAHLKGFISGTIYTGSGKLLCVPGLNCYSCPGAAGACPLGALQNAIASSGSRMPTYVLGILMLYGLTLGRTICGFLCPFGLIQELLHKIPTPKLHKGKFTRILSYPKYIVLILFVIVLPLWYALQQLPVPAFCKYICPAGTLEGAVGLLSNPANTDKFSMLGLLFTSKFVIMAVVIGVCVFAYRAFCRFLCPLGAIYGLFSRVAVIGVKVEATKCIDCGRCLTHCKMDVRHVGDHECIHCGECMEVCPTKAITVNAGKAILHGPQQECAQTVPPHRKMRRLAWALALVLLAAVLAWINLADNDHTAKDDLPANPTAESVATGSEVGMLAPDFSVPIYGVDKSFTLSEHRGKTVVINFWATWCTPCCKELPYFDELFRKNSDEVRVIAIHADLVTDDVEQYLSGYDYQMPFALDTSGDILRQYGGSSMLPQTIIVDENGVITYNAVGSLTLERLESLIGR